VTQNVDFKNDTCGFNSKISLFRSQSNKSPNKKVLVILFMSNVDLGLEKKLTNNKNLFYIYLKCVGNGICLKS